LKEGNRKCLRISFFGHFGTLNLGNESTLQAILCHFRHLLPGARVTCICTEPEAVAAAYHIEAIPIRRNVVGPWKMHGLVTRWLRKLIVGIPMELYRWFEAYRRTENTDMLIIPGTGLLTDAYGLLNWGPYDLFKWSLISKLRGCKILFLSVGAGPVHSALGKFFVKFALSLASFRSYRDEASMKYLRAIGVPTDGDRVYPDLVFSLARSLIPDQTVKRGTQHLVGLGLMLYAGKYSVKSPTTATNTAYLDNLVVFANRLLLQGYDIRLLIGDACDDQQITREFKSLLRTQVAAYDDDRIVDEPAHSTEQLLSQIAETDVVVATRFHNVLLALLLNKPVIAISFHHKCAALMEQMGLSEYCHDINHMNSDRLIEQFQELERNAEKLKPLIRENVEQARKALDEQYNLIFKML
jgi:polysaccharide pyruvyl transferase WcaK-like protein